MKKIVFILALLIISLTLSIPQVFGATNWKINKITPDEAKPGYPQLATGKNSYGQVWVDDRESNSEIYFAQIARLTGKRIGKEKKLVDNDVHNLTPALVWNGKEYGLFWSYSKSAIYFTKLKENGKKIIGGIPTVTSTQGYAIHISAVWNGEEYGVTWWDVRDAPAYNPSGTRGRAFFVRVDKDGNKIGEEIPVSEEFSNPWQDYHPLMVWDGENYAIFWNDSRAGGECTGGMGDSNTYMAKVNTDGVKVLGDILLDKGASDKSQLESVVWDGSNYVITYRGSVTRAFLAKMDTDGNTLFTKIPINTEAFGSGSQVSWDGEKYYVAWSDGRDRTAETFDNIEIYYTTFDTEGNKLIPETRLTYHDAGQSNNTQIVFNKKSLGLVFLDSRDGMSQIYSAVNKINKVGP